MEEEAKKRKERLEAMRKRKLAASATNGRSTDNSKDTVQDLKFRSYTPNDENLKQHVQIATPNNDLFNLAPKKANWDLRRDVEKKLEKLDKRTQRAIVELIRQRLNEEGNIEEAIANAEARTKLEAKEDDDDDDE
ncbi:unnamed protein product [Cunninghamella blakesleeana]